MDDFDPYDDDHISGYLIDDLGDDDADFDDEDWADDFQDEADLLDDAPPEGAHLVEDEMWETSDDDEWLED